MLVLYFIGDLSNEICNLRMFISILIKLNNGKCCEPLIGFGCKTGHLIFNLNTLFCHV